MAESFIAFFRRATATESCEGFDPLPFQERYADDPFRHTNLTVPTGLGKTATAVLPWLYHVHQGKPGTPRRLVFVLPRRNLTEQTGATIRGFLATTKLDSQVALLELMSGSGDNAEKLRPEQYAVIVCTQDMYFSRALNRGYARSPWHWPIDFALLNQDCLLVFDELQLMSDALATSSQLAAFRNKFGIFGDAPCLWMTATSMPQWLDTVDYAALRPSMQQVALTAADLEKKIVHERRHAHKTIEMAPAECRAAKGCAEFAIRNHVKGTRTLIVANTVGRAREIFESIRNGNASAVLVHSRFRPTERRAQMRAIEAGEDQIVVSTQVLEAGINITSRLMITDVAPWASLVQRFGRVNRFGGDINAQIWWVDLPLRGKLREDDQERAYQPYPVSEVTAAIKKLGSIQSASPADLPGEDGPPPWRHVLRRSDLLDLFDTSPDISGNHIDVARFIRSGEERDCYVGWRSWDGGLNEAEIPALSDEELCPAPISEVRDSLKKRDFFTFNFSEDRWARVERDQLYPGMVLLARAEQGGYSTEAGWSPESRTAVPVVTEIATVLPEGDTSEPGSMSRRYDQSLRQHSDWVCEELDRILGLLAIRELDAFSGDLRAAASKHDWGKAHEIMQCTLYGEPRGDRELLAKSKLTGKHRVPHFRHELASAVAMLANGDSDLAAYLAAAHHGKVRVAIRSMPGEMHGRVRGIRAGDQLPAGEVATDAVVPEVTLSLDLMGLGSEPIGVPSWSDRATSLRDRLGPFRLAYLEMLIRVADQGASERPEEVSQ